jgi:hypothetical protein
VSTLPSSLALLVQAMEDITRGSPLRNTSPTNVTGPLLAPAPSAGTFDISPRVRNASDGRTSPPLLTHRPRNRACAQSFLGGELAGGGGSPPSTVYACAPGSPIYPPGSDTRELACADDVPHTGSDPRDRRGVRKRAQPAPSDAHHCPAHDGAVAPAYDDQAQAQLHEWANAQSSQPTAPSRDVASLALPLAADRTPPYHGSSGGGILSARGNHRDRAAAASVESGGDRSPPGVTSPKRRAFVPFPALVPLAEDSAWAARSTSGQTLRPDQQVRDYKVRTLGCTRDTERIRELSEVLKTISPRYDDCQQAPYLALGCSATSALSASQTYGHSQLRQQSGSQNPCMPPPPRSGGYLERSANLCRPSNSQRLLSMPQRPLMLMPAAGCRT